MEKDPVCGKIVTAENVVGTTSYQGRRYYFCSTECQQRFERDSLSYVVRRLEDKGRDKDRSEDS